MEQLGSLSSRTIRCISERVKVEMTQTLAQGQYHVDWQQNGNHNGKKFSDFFCEDMCYKILRRRGKQKG